MAPLHDVELAKEVSHPRGPDRRSKRWCRCGGGASGRAAGRRVAAELVLEVEADVEGGDGGEAVAEGVEGGGLGEEHEEPVQGAEEVGVVGSVRLEEVHSEADENG